jgi:uncharacterized delta-60 repeat protein
VIAGSSGTGSNFDFAVARFTTSGALDTSFSGDGIVTTAISSLFDAATSVALDSSGRIVVGGYSLGGVRTNDLNRDFVVVRYTTAGVLDTAFSGDGIVTSDLGSLKDTLTSLAIDKNGRIVATGSTKAATGNTVIALARYTAAGLLDTSFDTDGIVTTALGTLYDSASAIAFDSYNRIILAGSTQTSGSTLLNTDEDLAITRYWP